MDTLKTIAVTIMLVGPLFAAAEPPSPQPLAIQVEGNIVTATGLTPGGACAVIVSWRMRAAIVETWRARTADEAGVVSAAFPFAAPAGGLIAVIDVATGRLQVTVGDGSFFERIDLPAGRFKRDDARDVDEVASPQVRAMTVIARPGEGVWVQRGFDGAGGDADGSVDGRIRTDPAAMTPIGDSGPAPQKIKRRDTVLVIDLMSGTFASTEVEP
jgi:hypothetical protein